MVIPFTSFVLSFILNEPGNMLCCAAWSLNLECGNTDWHQLKKSTAQQTIKVCRYPYEKGDYDMMMMIIGDMLCSLCAMQWIYCIWREKPESWQETWFHFKTKIKQQPLNMGPNLGLPDQTSIFLKTLHRI